MPKIKVMSFNLRYPNKDDGVNYFWERKERVIATVLSEAPDLIGFQEAPDDAMAFLADNLTGYTVLHCGREADFGGEGAAVAFKNGKFALLSMKTFWLSPTPAVPGSRYTEDQSVCPRVSAVLRLALKGGRPFTFLNTHLDHAGTLARQAGMQQNFDCLAAYDGHYIYMGDMNAEPHDPELAIAAHAMERLGGRDITADLGPTFHNFDKPDPHDPHWRPIKIDYIFTSAAAEDVRCVPDEGHETGLFYSDHAAIVATLELSDEERTDAIARDTLSRYRDAFQELAK